MGLQWGPRRRRELAGDTRTMLALWAAGLPACEVARSVLGGKRHRGAQWAWGPGRQPARSWEASPTPALQPRPVCGALAPSSCSHTPWLSVWKAQSGGTRHPSGCEPELCAGCRHPVLTAQLQEAELLRGRPLPRARPGPAPCGTPGQAVGGVLAPFQFPASPDPEALRGPSYA